ncbi:conserved protein of unknown function (plasmid) [Cupriavidus taiwanensis]|uniref:Uncharacterized protein n=1 Tax=Cupriavidus taiwanensis TaxID=164546 RepID=A0A9Q7V004_9BURK|nr:hypothetical protein [Cupriavidus taiwanensis]SPD67822.1 conserved protein of unknown function [Cupriavidus taiwanensis]
MRDVTDNRTGELEVGEVKRVRGRPRKANAMSNAERQAAYRARRRASVTVTKSAPAPRLIVDQVDAYDECRLEVDALHAELAEAHETIDELNDELIPLRVAVKRLEEEVAELNQQFVRIVAERDRAKGGEMIAGAEVVQLRVKLAKAEMGAAKSVTGNEKQSSKAPAKKAVTEIRNGKLVRVDPAKKTVTRKA